MWRSWGQVHGHSSQKFHFSTWLHSSWKIHCISRMEKSVIRINIYTHCKHISTIHNTKSREKKINLENEISTMEKL